MAFDSAWSDLSHTMDKVVDHWFGSFMLNVLAYSTVLLPLYVLVAYVKNHPNIVQRCKLIIIKWFHSDILMFELDKSL